ncbi:MAG: helix-turn-helix domain-containing protein [Brevundimonas sp.]|jgi:CRP/FNR family transcriptional regulator
METRLFQTLLEQRACSDCVLKPMCKPAIVKPDELERMSNHVLPRRSLRAGERLYERGQKVRSLFVSQAGVFKTESLATDGRLQVLGFHFPGELMGLEAIAGMHFRADAFALEPAAICEIPLSALETAASRQPDFQHHLLQAAGSCLAEQQEHVELLAMRQADERVALFLFGLLQRAERISGKEETAIHLAMGRTDLASYLCLTIETVSRTFSALRDAGILAVQGRHLTVVDRQRLLTMAGSDIAKGARRA